MAIHPTAVISPKAQLDPSVEVGPYVVIEEQVRIGPGTRILAHAYLTGHTESGRDNRIHMGHAFQARYPQLSAGGRPQYLS